MKRKLKIISDSEGKTLATYDPTPNPLIMVKVAEEEIEEKKRMVKEFEIDEYYEHDVPKLYEKLSRKVK